MDDRDNSQNVERGKGRGRIEGSSSQQARISDKSVLLVNHFKVEFSPDLKIICYQVDITRAPLQTASGSGTNMSREDKRAIMREVIKENRAFFQNAWPVYDGETNLYSPFEFAEGDFEVKLSKGKDNDAKEYIVKLRVKPKRIGEYHDNATMKQEFLQTLVVKEHPRSSYIVMGRSFHKEPGANMYGVAIAKGFSMSLRPTRQGLNLNVDYSVAPFYTEIEVLDYLRKNNIVKQQKNCPLDPIQRRRAERALRGLKVSVFHRKSQQKFTVVGLTERTTKEIEFQIGGHQEKISIIEYYYNSYNKRIVNVELPCLDLSKKPSEQIFVPMEFCMICKRQRVLKDNLNSEVERKLGMKIMEPSERCQEINQIMRNEEGPTRGQYLHDFKMTVHTEMTEVKARILDAPRLMVGKKESINPSPDKCQWNMNRNSVLKGEEINNWGIILFSSRYKKHMFEVRRFKKDMVTRFKELDIKINENPLFDQDEEENLLNDRVKLERRLLEILNERKKKPEILICIMERKHPGYKTLKLICETKIGLATQCCLINWDKSGKQKNAYQYLANLALKVNAKVGGSNVALSQDPSNQKVHTVYFGADVNHPTNHDKECPSIAAVVMSINYPLNNRYVVRMQHQKHRQEIISNLEEMCKELLVEYAKANTNTLPETIIFFRDGVGEWQFDEVRKTELKALENAFKQIREGYNPKITFILAQKRHHTRLFQKSGLYNVLPGTVVDTTIVHPSEPNFYLCSHYNTLGTSKVTHYYVLFDDNRFSPEKLQELIYNLCFTFATCTKPVSLVPPVYYADRAAYRGRLYIEAERGRPSSEDNINILLPIENSMFFI